MNFGKTLAIVESDLSEVAISNAAANQNSDWAMERNLLERLKAADSTAYDELIIKFSGDVYGLLFRLTEDAEDARDLTQETFMRVVQAVGKFRGEASLKTWLFRIAINQARNRRRWWQSRHKQTTISLDDAGKTGDSFLHETLADQTAQSPESEMLRREQSLILRRALQEIPTNFREAVILRDIEGLSYEEIAVALETNIGTVKSRISRGRDELKKRLIG
ncbi:MAG: sigma-70 family RNA polymerase sigma factor [Pyrinomonadaceae bacterium]|nr:sigma-70 family RNA polymerase sigma factor [Pyrinomonadaceae bacterium]